MGAGGRHREGHLPARSRVERPGEDPEAVRPCRGYAAGCRRSQDLPHKAGALAESRLAAKPLLREVSTVQIVQSVIEKGIR